MIKIFNRLVKINKYNAIILAGASGTGKTTVAQHLLQQDQSIHFSVSACTRPQRPEEIHGKSYYFLSRQEFEQRITNNAFIEWEEVYRDVYYGTPKKELDKAFQARKIILFDINVSGGAKLKSFFKENALAIYLQVPSDQVRSRRLEIRNTESTEEILHRMQQEDYRDPRIEQFDAILDNQELQTTLRRIRALVRNFKRKVNH